MMKTLFITALEFIQVEASLARGIKFADTHFLTNDKKLISGLFSEYFARLVGEIEYHAIKEAPAVIYSIVDHKQIISDDNSMPDFLKRNLELIQTFLMCLWLIKDNSVNFDLGFLEHPYRAKMIARISSNSRTTRFQTAMGETRSVTFSESEIRLARDLFNKLFKLDLSSSHTLEKEEVYKDDTSRIERAFYFSQAARGSSDLGIKVANYVTCFESLFCSDSAEIAHKLSERVTILNFIDTEERISSYRKMKRAYSLRSKVVHGDKLSNKLIGELEELSIFCDNLLRKTFHKILTTKGLPEIFSGDKDKFEDFMLKSVFERK